MDPCVSNTGASTAAYVFTNAIHVYFYTRKNLYVYLLWSY